VKAAHVTARRSSLDDAVRRCVDEISARSQSLLDSEDSHLLSEAELMLQLDDLTRECESGEMSLVEGWGCSEEEYAELFTKQLDAGLSSIRRNLLLVHSKLVKMHERSKPIEAVAPEQPAQREKRPLDSADSSSLKRRRTVKVESEPVSRHTPARLSSKKRRQEAQDDETEDDGMAISDTSAEALEPTTSAVSSESRSSVAEQKRKAKEWSERFNSHRRSSVSGSGALSPDRAADSTAAPPLPSPPPLNPLEAAKLAAQERIKSKVQSRVNQLAQSVDLDGSEASPSTGRRSSVSGKAKRKR
jgi:hypothetical protein